MNYYFARLALIGSGPSTLYLLKNLCGSLDKCGRDLREVYIFERSSILGTGMPYSPLTTDKYNMCNISSAEIPTLCCSLVDWLHSLDDEQLATEDIARSEIDEDEIYRRTTLGNYFRSQFACLVQALRSRGVQVYEYVDCEVTDIADLGPESGVEIRYDQGQQIVGKQIVGKQIVDRVVVATGHAFTGSDDMKSGYYASPWPMHKLIPNKGELYNFKIGTLGSSLSAFDVVASLANRHGKFVQRDGKMAFACAPGAEGFGIVLHSANGWLPHLQYEQEEPFREIYRHVERQALLSLRDGEGFLSLDAYFDHVCRPALIAALDKDNRRDIADDLRNPDYSIEDFIEQMSTEHSHADAFVGMESEMPEASRSLRKGIPIHWKEVLDDLIFTLNFHYELLSAEDHLRYRQVIVPFLMNVIAAMPLRSAQMLLALHAAGKLELEAGHVTIKEKGDGETTIEIDRDGEVTQRSYRMFIDCSGQGSLEIDEYPFPSLVKAGVVTEATATFRNEPDVARLTTSERDRLSTVHDQSKLGLGGISIDGLYRVVGANGKPNHRIHDIAFPHVTGIRPYSYGLQACSVTAAIVVGSWIEETAAGAQLPPKVEVVTELYDGLIDA